MILVTYHIARLTTSGKGHCFKIKLTFEPRSFCGFFHIWVGSYKKHCFGINAHTFIIQVGYPTKGTQIATTPFRSLASHGSSTMTCRSSIHVGSCLLDCVMTTPQHVFPSKATINYPSGTFSGFCIFCRAIRGLSVHVYIARVR